MKLIAHSLIPVTRMPYLHLGYLSAMTGGGGESKNIAISAGAVGIALLILGVSIARKFRRFIPVLLGALLAFGGVVMAVFAGDYLYRHRGPLRNLYPNNVTEERLYTIYTQLKDDADIQLPIPATTHTLTARLAHRPGAMQDGWFHPIRYRRDGATQYTLTSAGPDSRYDTADDITLTVDKKGNSIYHDPARPKYPTDSVTK